MIRTSFDLSSASRSHWLAHPGGEVCDCIDRGAEDFAVVKRDTSLCPVLRYVVCENCYERVVRIDAEENKSTQEPS